MTSIRLSGSAEPLGQARKSSEFSGWNEEWLRAGAKSKVVSDLGRSTLLLHDIEYSLMPESGSRVTFIPQEEFAEGREDSKHQIEFGQAIFNGQGVHEEPEFIALKPFDDAADLKREWAVSQYLNESHDDQHALLPLGVYRDLDDNLSLITAYEHGIKSFDSVFWADRNINPEALRPMTVQRHIKLGLTALGMLHGSRVVHNDAQAKNMASDRKSVRFIDLEDAEIIHEDSVDDPLSIEKTRRDLRVFINSVTQVDENKEYVLPILRDKNQEDLFVKSYARGARKGRSSQNGLYLPNFGKDNEEHIRDLVRKQ